MTCLQAVHELRDPLFFLMANAQADAQSDGGEPFGGNCRHARSGVSLVELVRAVKLVTTPCAAGNDAMPGLAPATITTCRRKRQPSGVTVPGMSP